MTRLARFYQFSFIHLSSVIFYFLLIAAPLSDLLQRRTVKKGQAENPKPMKDSDIVRERIIRRAALEFEDGMYGMYSVSDHVAYILSL